MGPQHTVLVTDGHLRAALAVVRSLGRAGYRVCVCSSVPRSLAGSSRYAFDHERVPDALDEPVEFGAAVQRLVERWGVNVLVPMSEESLIVLLDNEDMLRGLCTPFPDLPTFLRVCDKREILNLAASLGVAVPNQVVLADPSDPIPTHSLSFPVVVKPSRSVGVDTRTRRKFGVQYAETAHDLREMIDGMPNSAFPILLQKRVKGPGTGVFLLLWESEILAQFAHRRIREMPPSGGVSVCAESIAPDPELVAQSKALLNQLGWQGPAMVEFKEDVATGRHYLMEINGRFWGSLQLAIASGVDFPRLAVEAALGSAPDPVNQYRVGLRWRWWWGEVDYLLARVRGISDPNVEDGMPAAIKRFLFSHARSSHGVFRLRDPCPFAVQTLEWLRGR